MMDQQVVNFLFMGASALAGFVLNSVWNAVKDLQESDKEIAEKISSIEVLVAGNYVKREEFERSIQRIFEKLDHIDAKIEGRRDRIYNE